MAPHQEGTEGKGKTVWTYGSHSPVDIGEGTFPTHLDVLFFQDMFPGHLDVLQ